MRLALGGVLAALVFALTVQGESVHRDSFEARQPVWQAGPTDAPTRELAHEITTKTAHSGQQSEFLQITAEQGTFAYYVYPVGRVDLVEDLQLSLWLKANRPGMQFLARLVLPRERDPSNLDQPLTTLLRGDTYEVPGRWQPLKIANITSLVQQQKQLLRAQLQRKEINFDGAYVDQLLVNVYGGKGLNEVWIDDLEISPVLGELALPAKQPKATGTTTGTTPAERQLSVELHQDRLLVDKRPFFIRGIRYSDTPLKTLRDAGFNTLWFDYNTRPEVFEEAVNLGFWLAPHVPVLEDNPRVATPASLAKEVTRFPYHDAVLFWHVGSSLTYEQAESVGKAAATIRNAAAMLPNSERPVAGDIWDGSRPYSRQLDMIGIHRWPLMTGLELTQYRDWLTQRNRLTDPGTFTMTWVQTHLPDWYVNLVYDRAPGQGFDEPIGPQPEQIRLLTYVALSAGYRGLGFWSDRYLANSHQGRDRLLQLAILNQELAMLEPMLATTKEQMWVTTRHPEVRCAVLRYEGGLVVLPMWLGRGAQFVPSQMAASNLELVIPGAPNDAQVWEVSPSDVRSLEHQKVAGGIQVSIPEFGLTTALVITPDMKLVGELQQATRRTRKLAAQWSYDLALEELKKIEYVDAQLEQIGQGLPDGRALLDRARRHLNNARDAWNRGGNSDYAETYAEAQRALRPLRILMRAHWERAVKIMDSPVSSPYAVSFFTLPRHWQFVEKIRGAQPRENLLQHGDFEVAPGQTPEAWSLQEETLDAVSLKAERVSDQPKEGRQCLKLEIKPENARFPPAALERTFLAINSPAIRLHPGSLVRISGWVRIPDPIQASADGVLFFDSIGGEPLGIRLTAATPWRRFHLYREVPASGTVSVTMALNGIGTAYFDDVRIEPLHPTNALPGNVTAKPSPSGR